MPTKKPIRGIAKVADLRPKAVYGKIDFIFQQCLGFLGEREAEAHKHRRQYVRLCVDKQDYMINWRGRKTRKNTQFTSIATVEGKTGYVLSHHLNFEPDVEQVAFDDLAKAHGDLMAGSRPAFHAQSQYWKSDEFAEHALSPGFEVPPDPDEEPLLVQDLIQLKDAVMANWPYPEMSDCPGSSNKLPGAGVMTHSSYTAYAHALLVRQLIETARKIDIYSDQDDVLRNSYISAVKGSVLSDRANMAYVQFQKHMTIDEKRQLTNRARARLAASASRLNLDEEVMIARMMGLEYAARCEGEAAWRRRWVPHPKDTLNEPRRRVQFVTDTGRKSLEEILDALGCIARACRQLLHAYSASDILS